MMRAMSVQAVGGYIEGLIKRGNLTIAEVAETAGVQANYIWRLTEGDIKAPGAQTLGSLIAAARGNIAVAMALLLSPDATFEDGKAAAMRPEARLSDRHLNALQDLSDEDLDLLIELAERMRRRQ